jgi:hemerythrin-like domain-containing protein
MVMIISEILMQEHRECDEAFAQAETSVADSKWEQAESQFKQFYEAMVAHIAVEEDSYFPAFEARHGMAGGATDVMRAEHAQMRDLADRMREALAARDADGYLGCSETLCMLMRQHNLKEEHVLYPMFDDVLDAGDFADSHAAAAKT